MNYTHAELSLSVRAQWHHWSSKYFAATGAHEDQVYYTLITAVTRMNYPSLAMAGGSCAPVGLLVSLKDASHLFLGIPDACI